MATQPSSGHKRTDSGVDSNGIISDNLTTVQSFYTAVSSLTSEHGFQAINELVKLVPQRELEIKAKDETIRNLRDELVALQKDRDVFNDRQLSNFEGRYEKWNDENTTLQNEIEELEVALEEKDSKVTKLQSQLGNIEARVDDLEKENAQLTKKVKEKGLRLGEIEAKLQSAQADLEGQVEKLKETQNQMNALQGSFENEANQHKVLREEANKIRLRFNNLVQLSVKITELDLPNITARMEKLWTVATKLVENFFGRDMPDNILKNDWTGLRENATFKHQIPLPQSNTDAARRTRAAVILGVLTRLVDRFIFQPTYLLDEESGLREILRNEAAVDPVKERYVRGILLSMSPEEQDTISEKNLQHISEELLETANVRALLTPETFSAFPQALDQFLRQCRDEWKIIQRSKQKLEPSFTYSTCANYPWQLFDSTHADTRDGKHSEGLSATTAIENNIVLIPRIYLVVTKDDPDPITHGCVLRKTHFDAAAEELRSSIPSAPFAQATSSRHRNRPMRTMSTSSNNKPFLV